LPSKLQLHKLIQIFRFLAGPWRQNSDSFEYNFFSFNPLHHGIAGKF
jgi:hypothetical protein